MKATQFLKESAVYVKNKYNDLSRCCIVLPSNRSASVFKQFLAAEFQQSAFLPDIRSIASLMDTLSDTRQADNVTLLLQLFDIHRSFHPGDNASLMQFAGYAEMLLRDFNDIDISLADGEELFSYLLEIKEIEAEFDQNGRHMLHQRYLDFCRELPAYYRRLRQRLSEQGLAYQGMQYRYVCEQLASLVSRFPFDRYIFIGFSALSIAEEHIIKQLFDKQMAEFIVDDDAWYISSSTPYLAGRFLNDLQKRIPLTRFRHDYLHETEKEVHIWGFPQETTQADCLPGILRNIREGNPSLSREEKGVIVLLREQLLLPVLYALPEETSYNVSMEYGLRQTPLYDLLHAYWMVLEDKEKFSTGSGQPRLYHKDVRAFLENSLLQQRFAMDGFLPDLTQENRLFYSRTQWEALLAPLPEATQTLFAGLFFRESADACAEQMCRLLEYVSRDGMPALYRQMAESLKQKIQQFQPLLASLGQCSVRDLRFLWKKLLSALSFPFESDPKRSLQIYGMLETRALDFDYVILLSANEGVIPNTTVSQTLIPYDVRCRFQLPTFQNHEAIMTYHFYRLLQRAENIYLIYNMDGRDEIREKSRLLRQVACYWKALPNITLDERVFPLPQPAPREKEVLRIAKGAQQMELLQHFSFSPSSINLYLTCPLQFCLKYLYRLQPPEEPDEEIQANTMGSVIHKILERRVNPEQQWLDTRDLEDEVMRTFLDPDVTGLHLSENDISHEKNLLVKELSLFYLKRYLDLLRKKRMESGLNPVLAVERKFSQVALFEAYGHTIYCNGCIDRIDLEKEISCIIDYKSGYLDTGTLRLSAMEELFDGKHKEALQLMLYMYAMYRMDGFPQLMARIVSLQHPEEDGVLRINGNEVFGESDFQLFATLIQQCVFEPIWDERQRFTPSPGDHCTYCPFADVCSDQLA